jgi:hypothetical protein
MTTQVGRQAAARATRPPVPVRAPIPASKITAPGVPDWALTRPPRPHRARRTNEPTASGIWRWWKLLRGRLCRAGTVSGQATAALTAGEPQPPVPHPNPAALVALAWVHLEHNELPEAHTRLKQADTALGVTGDKLIGAVAKLAAAYGALAGQRAAAAVQIIARARSGWSVPAWPDQRLSQAGSQAYAAAGDIQAALAAAGRASHDNSPEGTVILARAWVAAGDPPNAPARSRRSSPPTARRRTGCACKRGWLTHSFATKAGTAREAAAHLPPRCGWPDLSR